MTVKTPARTAFPIIPYRKTTEIDYDSLDFDPHESVEKPDAMEQHEEQLEMLILMRACFSGYGKRPDVFVDFDSNICYDPDDLRRHVSPDVYIAFGVDAKAIRPRLIYLPWEAGKPPDLVMEIATADTAREDVEIKPDIYEAIAAQEYWMFDAAGGRYYGNPLKGLKLVDGKYQDIHLTREPDGILKGYSDVLGVSVAWDDGVPRLYDRASGEYLENQEEMLMARPALKARTNAAIARREAAEARREAAVKEREAIQAESGARAAELAATQSEAGSRAAEQIPADARANAESKAREAADARAAANAKERAAELAALQAEVKEEEKARATAQKKIRDLRELIWRMELADRQFASDPLLKIPPAVR